jgi:hypothetical protein
LTNILGVEDGAVDLSVSEVGFQVCILSKVEQTTSQQGGLGSIIGGSPEGGHEYCYKHGGETLEMLYKGSRETK